jgi:alanine dehydrogenase
LALRVDIGVSAFRPLNALDVAALALSDDEILAAVAQGFTVQGRGETVIEPRMHLVPD